MDSGGLIPGAATVGWPGRFITARELLLTLLGRRRRFRAVNTSMLPAICPGDHLLVDCRAFARRSPRVGEIVVATHPLRNDMTLVKRVARVAGPQVWLSSDNSAQAQDSRQFGCVRSNTLLGRVTAVIS